MPIWFQAIMVLLIVWVLARLIKRNVPILQRYFIPSSIIGGFLLLIIGHQVSGIIPNSIIKPLATLPAMLINVVFAGLFLGKKAPTIRQAWQQSAQMVAFGNTIAWGMYAIGITLTLLVLAPFFGASEAFGALLEISFTGGHGTAAGLAPTFAQFGAVEVTDIALGLATLSIITAVISGIAIINIYNRRIGRIIDRASLEAQQRRMIRRGYDLTRVGQAFEKDPTKLFISLIIFALSIIVGWLILQGLIWLENLALGSSTSIRVFAHLPLFPLAMFGGLIVQSILGRLKLARLIHVKTVRTISSIALDLLIITAIGTISLNTISHNFAAFLLLAAAGMIWTLAAFFLLAPRFFRKHWFEYGMTDLGQAMGMTATGLLLNRLADPLNRTGARESFAYKQLLFEPFMGGGIVTAFAVVAIAEFGAVPVLIVCLVVFLFWLSLGLMLGRKHPRRSKRSLLGRLALRS